MGKKLFYTNPLHAAIMAQEFGVEFIDDVDEVSMSLDSKDRHKLDPITNVDNVQEMCLFESKSRGRLGKSIALLSRLLRPG